MSAGGLLVLNRGDVERALSMAGCIEVVEQGLHDRAAGRQRIFPRHRLDPLYGGAPLGIMAACGAPDAWAVKLVHRSPANRARGLDTHQGVVVLSERATGRPLAILDATAITALRTAALSAVATHLLAPRRARRVVILGTGAQAARMPRPCSQPSPTPPS